MSDDDDILGIDGDGEPAENGGAVENGDWPEPPTDDDTDEGPGATEKLTAAADRVGEWTGAALGTTMATLPRLIPRQSRLFRAMVFASLKNYHKRAGGDALALDAQPGQKLDLTPVKYRTPEECEEGEKPGWKAKGEDKVWSAGSEGRVVDYIGKVPIVALDRDSHVETGWLRPRIAEAIELDNYNAVYTNPQLTAVAPVVGDLSENGALADGGQINPEDVGLEPNNPGQWAGDALLDLDSGEGYDGMRISFRKATEWMAEHTTTDEMQRQEDRGILKGQLGEDGPNVVRLFLYAALFSLAVIAVVYLGPMLLDGGGGGGGINPLMINALASLTPL